MVDDKRKRCIAKYNIGWEIDKICETELISRATMYRWINSYQMQGLEGLAKRSTRPKTIHYKLDQNIIDKIIEIRKFSNMNEHGIRAVLRNQGISVGHTSIYNVLKSNGLIRSLSEKRKQKTYIRFQRKHPNSLWQTDLTNWNEQVVIAYIDDCSRFVTGIDEYANGITANVIAVFQTAIDSFGKPRQVLSDHGTQFYNVHGGDCAFDRFCSMNGIEHILGAIAKPTTTGKIERFFKTFKMQVGEFGSIGEFVKFYNFERPHKSLDFRTPADVYFGENVS